MLFSSLDFLYLFLPLSLITYYLCPIRVRNGALFAMSLIFYGVGEPIFLLLMLLTVSVDYAFGLLLARRMRRGGRGSGILAAAVGFHLLSLGIFKYYDPLAALLGLPLLGLPLPIGISFYSFQALSYVADVYRREAEAQRNYLSFGTYVTLFPQLVAGPIVRYTQLDRQLAERRCTLRSAADGATLFAVGLAKKVILANGAGALSVRFVEVGETAVGAWLLLILYGMQIYFDFSGYSDMAVGLGRLFGFELPRNFCYPYCSESITDFWRRWHITLSSWFREYVYIPLGGNRRGRWRTCLNLLITWSLTGIWHGATPNFLLWGLYFFLLLWMEKQFLGRALERLPRALRRLYALPLIFVGWRIFAADGSGIFPDLSPENLGGLFRLWEINALVSSSPAFSPSLAYALEVCLPFLLIAALGATPLPAKCSAAICRRTPRLGGLLRVFLVLSALLISTAYLVDSGYNPFLYFRF